MKILATIATALLVMLSASIANGQDAPARDPRTEAIDRLILVLEDDAVRTDLLEQLRKMSATPPAASNQSGEDETPTTEPQPGENIAAPGLIDVLSEWSTTIVEQLPTTTFGIPIDQKAQQAQTQLATRIEAGVASGELTRFFMWALPGFMIVVAGGLFLRRVGRGLTAPTQPVRKRLLAVGVSLKIIANVAFFLLAALILSLMLPQDLGTRIFLTLSAGLLLSILMTDLAMAGLSALGGMRGVRVVHFAQRRLFKWALPIGMLSTFAALLRDAELRRVVGWSAADIASFTLNMSAAAITLALVIRHRMVIGRLIFGRAAHSPRSKNAIRNATRRLARYWHLLAYAFIGLSAVSLFAGQRDNDVFTQVFWSFGTVLVGLVAVALLHRLYDGVLNRRRRLHGAVRHALIAGMLRVTRLATDIAIALFAIVVIARIWGFDLWGWLQADGRQLSQPLAAAAICAVITWLIWVALDAWIASALTPTDAFGRPRQRSNRAQTLLPLLRNSLMMLLVLLAGIAILANIGVDVTPLLAGAGVFGLAISFGSQQLVQDVITGVFILAEDTLAIGDTINTGDRSGVVEGISLRTVRLRDADGALHSIPFSTIKALKNSSRNFGVFRPRYSVPSSVDPEQVLDAMRDASATLKANPRYTSAFMGDLQNLGIEEINAGSVIVSGSLRTAPLRQADLTRAFNGTFRALLAERGIEL